MPSASSSSCPPGTHTRFDGKLLSKSIRSVVSPLGDRTNVSGIHGFRSFQKAASAIPAVPIKSDEPEKVDEFYAFDANGQSIKFSQPQYRLVSEIMSQNAKVHGSLIVDVE